MSALNIGKIRRLFPALIASEIVSVQPMSLPSGSLFYMDYVYGSSTDKFNISDYLYRNPIDLDPPEC